MEKKKKKQRWNNNWTQNVFNYSTKPRTVISNRKTGFRVFAPFPARKYRSRATINAHSCTSYVLVTFRTSRETINIENNYASVNKIKFRGAKSARNLNGRRFFSKRKTYDVTLFWCFSSFFDTVYSINISIPL